MSNIEHLLEGNLRFWNQKDWFKRTVEYLISDLEETLEVKSAGFSQIEHSRLINKVKSTLFSIDVSDNEALNDLRNSLMLFAIHELELAEEHLFKALRLSDESELDGALETLIEVLPSESITAEKAEELLGLLLFFFAVMQIEKLEFGKSNEYFMRGYQLLKAKLSSFDKINYLVEWSYLFFKSNNVDLAETILSFVISNLTPQKNQTYSRTLYIFFLINKTCQMDSVISYVNLLLSFPEDFLGSDDWYSIHIFCGEYFTIRRDFYKSIYHFKMANSFLSKKWKEYVEQISLLKNTLVFSEYEKIRTTYEEKIFEFILDNNLHNNHYLTSLKNAYDELQNVYTKLQEAIYIDSLTDLYNRRYLWEKAHDFVNLAVKENVPISCFVIDIDDFKKINDTYTHIEGDKVLKAACKTIKDFFRKSDIVVRFGGEEILVLLFNLNKENSLTLAEKLRKAIEELSIISDKGKLLKITISVGVSNIDNFAVNDTNIVNKLIEEADRAMYLAKRSGKNRVVNYQELKDQKQEK